MNTSFEVRRSWRITRNIRHFAPTGVPVLDPFGEADTSAHDISNNPPKRDSPDRKPKHPTRPHCIPHPDTNPSRQRPSPRYPPHMKTAAVTGATLASPRRSGGCFCWGRKGSVAGNVPTSYEHIARLFLPGEKGTRVESNPTPQLRLLKPMLAPTESPSEKASARPELVAACPEGTRRGHPPLPPFSMYNPPGGVHRLIPDCTRSAHGHQPDGGRTERPHLEQVEQHPAQVRGRGAVRCLSVRPLLHRHATGLTGTVPVLHHGRAADRAHPLRAAGDARDLSTAGQRGPHGRAARPAQQRPLRHGPRRRMERVGARGVRRAIPGRRRTPQPPRGGHSRHARAVGARPRQLRGPLLHPQGRRLPAQAAGGPSDAAHRRRRASGAPCALRQSTRTSGTASA